MEHVKEHGKTNLRIQVIVARVFEKEKNVKKFKINGRNYIKQLKYINNIKKHIKTLACFEYSLYLCIAIKK